MARCVCIGTCGGSVSEEEFRKGKNKCGMKGCIRLSYGSVKIDILEEAFNRIEKTIE